METVLIGIEDETLQKDLKLMRECVSFFLIRALD